MAYSPTEVNEKYWRKLTEAASQSLQEKMHLLDDVDGFTRDNSFHGNKASNHMMYKLESLFSKDGHREYEFLVEYDIWEPTVGIYYGCKGLIHEGEVDKEIAKFDEEWNVIINEVLYVLNNTFPEKDYTHRFKPTNNANDNTYWPFWISLYEDEDIIDVAARATIIIRNIYHKYLNGTIFTKHEIEPKHLVTKTAFTQDAYIEFISSLKTNDNVKSFKKLMEYLSATNLVERNETYERCWTVKMQNVDFAFLWAAFCEYIGIKKKEDKAPVPWQNVIKIFVNKDGETYKDNLKRQYSDPTVPSKYNKMYAKKQKKIEAEQIIVEIFGSTIR
jgi:hypothetical protein